MKRPGDSPALSTTEQVYMTEVKIMQTPRNGNLATLDSLAMVPCWLSWRMEEGERKTPYIDGRQGWKGANQTRAQAEKAAETLLAGGQQGGVAVVLGDLPIGLYLCGLDLDRCRDPAGALTEWAQAELDALNTYAEISPSGTGIKAFFLMEGDEYREVLAELGKPGGKQRFGAVWKRGTQKHAPGIELYLGGRWFAVTDNRLPDAPEAFAVARSRPLLELIRERGPALKGAGAARPGGRSERVMGVAARMKANGASKADYERWIANDAEASAWLKDHDPRQFNRAWERSGWGTVSLTEDGVAQVFADQFGERLRYDHTSAKWYVWTGTHWQRDDTRLAFHWSRLLCRELRKQRAADPRARALATRKTAEAVEAFARADDALAVKADRWDADPWLLGTPGGTVELRTGELREARPGDFISMVTTVAPVAEPFDAWLHCPKWIKFLGEATGGDDEAIRFLQQYAGYCLTGSVREHALLFVYGPGGNGKSTFQGTLANVLGDYSRAVPMETFAASGYDRHPTELANMKGARLCYASETEEGRAWAENRLKQMTGGDKVSARFMRQDLFEFEPTFKLLFIGNNRPRLKNVDDAARRRFMILPFPHVPEPVNKELADELRAEWPGILAWAIAGCRDWQQNGLIRPAAVRAATEAYFEEQDIFGQWIETNCRRDGRGRSSELYADYAAHMRLRGEEADNLVRFAEKMKQRGFVKVTIKGVPYYKGLALDGGFSE
jgi:putative DNA primase/helicase